MAKSDLNLPGAGAYALVASRITLFYERYPDGRIVTELMARSATDVTFRAAVYRSVAEREPAATGWASEREGDGEVNAVACLENTETSAVGRALANLGFTAAAHRPSAEEMAKASRARARLASAAGIDAGVGPHGTTGSAPRPPRGPHRVAEQSPEWRGDADAPLRADLLRTLERAERAGLRPVRSAAVRALLERADTPATKLEEAERWLRRWLERRQVALAASTSATDPAATG